MTIPAAGTVPAPGRPIPTVSAEICIVPLDDPGRYLVYAPLRRAAFIGNARTVNFLADLQQGRLDATADPDGSLVAFLRELEMVDAGPEPRPLVALSGDPLPVSVTLFLTTSCNLRCTYCYAAAGDTVPRFMPLSVAQRGIDFVLANAVAKGECAIEVALHGGGEPTLNWRTLTGAVRYAREQAAAHGIEVYASAASNGVYRETQLDWIIANLNGVSISFDGLPEVHDRHRVTIAGEGTAERVSHTMRRFDAAGFHYGVRVTVTADQIARLPDSVEYICAGFRPDVIQVEPAYQLGRWRTAPSAETVEFIAAYRQAQARAHLYGREIAFSAARAGTLTNHFCGMSQDSFCLSPDGNVSACYEAFSEENPLAGTFFYGKPAASGRGYTFDLPVLNHLRDQGVQHRDYCEGCFARWSCAGDCYHKALTVTGAAPGAFAGSDRCHIIRALTLDQILEKIAASGGVAWHEGGLMTGTEAVGADRC